MVSRATCPITGMFGVQLLPCHKMKLRRILFKDAVVKICGFKGKWVEENNNLHRSWYLCMLSMFTTIENKLCNDSKVLNNTIIRYVYSSCYHHHQIESIHLSHCYHIFRGCVSEVFVTSYSVTYCIYIPGNREFVFIIFVQFMMSANSQIRIDLKIVFVYLYITPSNYHHCASFSEDIELIKCLSDIVCRVCEWDKAYFLSCPLQNTWVCVFSVDPFSLWWLREYIYIYTLSYYHHRNGSMNYYPLFRVRSWNNGVCCMSFCILIDIMIRYKIPISYDTYCWHRL